MTDVCVSNSFARKLVQGGARCSKCGMPVNTHGGYVPCEGHVIVADHKRIIAALGFARQKVEQGVKHG